MFHRYVTHEGAQMDIDRAMWLMDKRLLADASAVLPKELGDDEFDRFIATRMGFSPNKPSTNADVLQTLWNEYCRLHEEKYGEPFNPDVM